VVATVSLKDVGQNAFLAQSKWRLFNSFKPRVEIRATSVPKEAIMKKIGKTPSTYWSKLERVNTLRGFIFPVD